MSVQNSDRSIKDWMGIFAELYSESDSKRDPEQIWVAIMSHSSGIGECVRRYAFRELLHPAAHTFCWLCSFVNKCNELKDDVFSFSESLCGIVSLKYPLACGHCECSPCSCSPIEMDETPDKSARYERLLEKRKDILKSVQDYPISRWKKIFRDIFAGQLHISTIESIGFHFLEEVGEGAFAVRKLGQLRKVVDEGMEGVDKGFLGQLTTVCGIVGKYKEYHTIGEIDYCSKDPKMIRWRIVEAKLGLVVEIGDTFSWFCSIFNKLDYLTEHSQFELLSLEKKLNEEYFDKQGNVRCPTCNSKPCSCVFFP